VSEESGPRGAVRAWSFSEVARRVPPVHTGSSQRTKPGWPLHSEAVRGTLSLDQGVIMEIPHDRD
jgi:hypothetical protein